MSEPDCCDLSDLVKTAIPLPWTTGGPNDHSKPQQTALTSSPVSVIDVQRFVTEYYSFKHKLTGWLFNAKLFCRLFLQQMKRWFGVSK